MRRPPPSSPVFASPSALEDRTNLPRTPQSPWGRRLRKGGLTALVLGFALASYGVGATEYDDDDFGEYLADGLYTLKTDVRDRADIAEDIAEMLQAADSGNYDEVAFIYRDGKNSQKSNGAYRSLSSLSTLLADHAEGEQIYISSLKASNNDQSYAHSVVEELLDEAYGSEDAEEKRVLLACAARAAEFLNVWGWVAHRLQIVVGDCQAIEAGCDVNSDQEICRYYDEDWYTVNNNSGGLHSIEEAVAYYIGADQLRADHNSGHMLYSLAEKEARHFHTFDENDVLKQAKTNVQFLKIMQEMSGKVMAKGSCGTDGDGGGGDSMKKKNTSVELRMLMNEAIGTMTVPLIQLLIRHMYEAAVGTDPNQLERHKIMVTVAVKALLPQISTCDEVSLSPLERELTNRNSEEFMRSGFNALIALLQKNYSCLGVTCAEVGSYKGILPLCTEPLERNYIGAYIPQSNANRHANIDLDVLQMDIYMHFDGFHEAEMLYKYGKNAKTEHGLLSLQDLATLFPSVPEGPTADIYEVYKSYYGETNFVHNTILDAFSGSNNFAFSSNTQRREIIFYLLRTCVTTEAVVFKMYQALNGCSSGFIHDITSEKPHAWDEAAAYAIGNLEGWGGKDSGGQFIPSLQREHCATFGTCTTSPWEEPIASLMELGLAHLIRRDCKGLTESVREIQAALLVPLIQGVLYYSVTNEFENVAEQKQLEARGYVYAMAVLPWVHHVDPAAAKTIKDVMAMEITGEQRLAFGGHKAVFDAFTEVLPKMHVPCEDVGTDRTYTHRNVCPAEGSQSDSGAGKHKPLSFFGKNVGIFVSIALPLLLL